MSAETLRKAASLMRARAKDAIAADNDLPWTKIPSLDPENDGWIVTHDPAHADYDTTVARCEYDFEGDVSGHIASWHPLVALAVADWLDQQAEWSASGNSVPAQRGMGYEPALAVARAYLGEQ